jgi:predicted ArsR family transcriptional regulator
MERDRVTVQEAARRLGISESGVRKRVKREQLDSERSSTHDRERGGRVYVYLDSVVTDADPVPDSVPDKYVASLEDQVEFLRDQVRRQQEIIAQQAVTMRQLSAAAVEEPTEDAQAVEEEPERAEPRSYAAGPQEGVQRPWWRRIIGR